MGLSVERKRPVAAAALVAALVAVLLAATQAPAASEGGPLAKQCGPAGQVPFGACRGVEQLAAAVSAVCRYVGPVPDGRCATPLNPRVVRAEIDNYEQTDLHHALGIQFALGNDVPFSNATWIGTHNSFNSVAEMGPTLSDLDANQQLSLTDQLRLDVRSLELDVHWFPSLHSGGRFAPVVCHAEGTHVGCTIERPLGPVLGEISAWLRHPHNSDQVLLLYIEDHLDGAVGHASGAAALRKQLGHLLYRPTGHGCTPLPLDLSRDDVLVTGARVIVVSGCGRGPAWPAVAFDWSSHQETRARHYTDFPRCGTDFDRATYDSQLIRYYEDSTFLTAGTAPLGLAGVDDGIQPGTAARMARCGVDLTGLDQLIPGDARLASLLWSWALGEPGPARCAVERVSTDVSSGRWFTRSCALLRAAACRTAAGAWLVTAAPVTEADAPATCAAVGAVHAVPRTGYEAQLLRVAMQSAGRSEVWLAYMRPAGEWIPLDPR